MIRARCPICGKGFETPTIDDWPGFPFCSDRCKLIDLGRWIDGDYAIPGGDQGKEEESSTDDADEHR